MSSPIVDRVLGPLGCQLATLLGTKAATKTPVTEALVPETPVTEALATGRCPQHLLVAFSGGTDSSALLWGLRQLAPEFNLQLTAVHLDHGLDDASHLRAAAARRLADKLEVPFHSAREPSSLPRGESLEAYARRIRYRFLSACAKRLNGDWIVTAHHLDDQAETVLLRLLFGSGLWGLAAIRPRSSNILRPLLQVPRQHLEALISELGLRAVEDPTNRDIQRPRNRLRHLTLPRLLDDAPTLVDDLGCLAASAHRARRRMTERLQEHLDPRPILYTPYISLDRKVFEALPPVLWTFALAWLAERNGSPYPPQAQARREIARQLNSEANVGCDCGDGWRFEATRHRIWVRPVEPSTGEFAYTLEVPGAVSMPELGYSIRLVRQDVAPWMFRGHLDRGVLSGERLESGLLTVRNRRPGDRIRPLGSTQSRCLSDLLIDRQVPRPWRDRLPLVIADGNIVWVPGVTIDAGSRLRSDRTAWVLSIERQPYPTQESVAHRVSSDGGSKERSKP